MVFVSVSLNLSSNRYLFIGCVEVLYKDASFLKYHNVLITTEKCVRRMERKVIKRFQGNKNRVMTSCSYLKSAVLPGLEGGE